jgi:hypothetical protein
LHGLAMDRMTCVRWPADSTTLFCLMRPSPTRRCARRRWPRDQSRSRLFIQRKGATHGLTAFHLSTNSSETIHRRRDRRAKPSRVLEGNAEGRLPVLRGGARDRRPRSVPRQRYSCRDQPVGSCLARMCPFRPTAKVVGARELPLRAKLVPTDERRRQIVKRSKWLPWESSETKSDHLKKVRQQTDQRMQQQEAQKEEREKNQSRSIGSAIDRPAR